MDFRLTPCFLFVVCFTPHLFLSQSIPFNEPILFKNQTNIAYMQYFRLEKGKINPSILYLLEIANGL
jgi:hypothetical protein